MRNWLLLGGISILAACGSDNTKCGDGTTKQGNTCVPDNPGDPTTCGAGTHLDGTMCVPDAPAATGAPTITSISPDHSGIAGGVLFTIDGTGFAGADVSALHVYFGDTTPGQSPGELGPCEAEIGAATPTEITGIVPVGCNFNVMVTVATNVGMATTNYRYEALLAAEGDAGATFFQGGHLWMIDPFAQLTADLGALKDTANGQYEMHGITFTSDGTLWGVTTGLSPADGIHAQLVKIDAFATGGPVVTVVGDLVDAGGLGYVVTDIKASGTTLYGWGVHVATATTGSLVTIDTTNGKVAKVGTPVTASYSGNWDGGLAIDASGAITISPKGAGPDTDAVFTTTGELDTVNPTTGALTNMTTLDWPIGAPINAMTYIHGALVAVVDNGTYGAFSALDVTMGGGLPLFYGGTLVVIDATAAQDKVTPGFELPAVVGGQSRISGMDMTPDTLTIAHRLPTSSWSAMAAGARVVKPVH